MQIGCWLCMARSPVRGKVIGKVIGNLWFAWHKLVCPIKGVEAEAMAEEMRGRHG